MRTGGWTFRGLLSRALFGVFCLVALWSACGAAWHAIAVGANDFQWSGARLLLHGVDAYRQVLSGDTSQIALTQIPNYAPALYVMLLPLGATSLGFAQTIWTVLNLAMFAAAGVMVARAVGLRGWRVIGLVSVFFWSWPFSIAVQAGQQTALALFMAVLACRVRSQRGAGLALGVMFTKYSFAPVAAVSLARRQWRSFALGAAVQAAGVVIFSVMTGSGLFATVLEPLRTARLNQAKGAADVMTLTRILGGNEPTVFGVAIATLMLLGWSGRRTLAGDSWVDALSVSSILSLLTFPHLVYDLCFLLPVLGSAVLRRGWPRRLLIGVIVLLWFGWALDPTYRSLSTVPGIIRTMTLLLMAGGIIVGAKPTERQRRGPVEELQHGGGLAHAR